ncbi:DsbA family protein [Nonomuraea ferruginea]
MRIEIWADVVCGWAYIGKRRVERALEGLDVEVVWRPFRIDPMAPAQAVPHEEAMADPTVDAALRRCAPDLTPGENRVRVALVAAEEGFGWTWGPAWRADSRDAHRLIALALEHGGPALQDAVAERVMKAHFLDRLDISDRGTLHRLAADAGFAGGGRAARQPARATSSYGSCCSRARPWASGPRRPSSPGPRRWPGPSRRR